MRNCLKLTAITAWCKGLLRTLIYLPLAILVVFALIVGTPQGTHLTVLLVNRIVPNIELVYGSGTINNQLTLPIAKWHMNGVNVDVKDLNIKWQPACLFNKQICVSSLNASGIKVGVKTSYFSSSTNSNTENSQVTLPFGINLNNANLHNIQVSVDDMRFNARHLVTEADWPQGTAIRVHQLMTQDLLVDIPLTARHKKKNSANKKTNNTWLLSQLPNVYNPVPVIVGALDLQNSQLNIGEHKNNIHKLNLKGSYIDHHIDIEELVVNHSMGKAKLSGNIDLDKDYPMHIGAQITLTHVPLIKNTKPQQINLKLNGGVNQLAIHVKGDGETHFSLNSNVALADKKLPYQLNLSAKKLQWPLIKPLYQVENLHLQSHGNILTQKVITSFFGKTPFYPNSQVATSLTHTFLNHTSLSKIDIENLSLVNQNKTAHINGNIEYQFNSKKNPALNWDLMLNGKNIDPKQIFISSKTQLPEGKINLAIHTTGFWSQKKWLVNLNNLHIDGELNHFPLMLTGNLSLDNDLHIKADNVHVKALGAELQAFGKASRQWNMQTQVMIPDLALLLPQAKGKLIAHINVVGEKENPKLEISSSVEHFSYQQLSVKLAQIVGNIALTGKQTLSITLLAHKLTYLTHKLTNIDISANGNIEKQIINVNTQGDIKLKTQIANNINKQKQTIKTVVNQFSIDSIIGLWKLNSDLKLVWNNQKKQGLVTPFCVVNDKKNKLCLNNTLDIDLQSAHHKTAANISFYGSVGAILQQLFPQNMTWRGLTNMQAHLTWSPKTKPSANVQIHFLPGSFSITRHKDIPAVIFYKKATIYAKLNEHQLSMDLAVDAGKLANIDSTINIDISPQKNLSGGINIHHINANKLLAFFPQIATLNGNIKSKLSLAGTLKKPLIRGKLSLDNGQLAISSNPTLIQKVDLTMLLSGQQAKVNANWLMGQGHGIINGLLSWKNDPIADFHVKGKNLAVILPPLAILTVSPDIRVRLTPHHTSITGDINVPNGEIKIVQLAAGGIPVSDDVVFQDSISASMHKSKPYPITTNININIMDKVGINGMGLNGDLAGKLNLQIQAFRPPLLYGEVKIINGTYRFLGQKLAIETGELQFSGPAADPNINIEAIRKIKTEDVIAGVKITGTPKHPDVSLFSNPTKEQAEILSYIIKGAGFSARDQNDALMLSAALSLGSQLDNGAIGNIGNTAADLVEKIGISNIQLDANDDGRVAISGFIGDRLMVKYGIGVFNPGYEFAVRYYLLSQLYLESISGPLEQSLDIYYSFDL